MRTLKRSTTWLASRARIPSSSSQTHRYSLLRTSPTPSPSWGQRLVSTGMINSCFGSTYVEAILSGNLNAPDHQNVNFYFGHNSTGWCALMKYNSTASIILKHTCYTVTVTLKKNIKLSKSPVRVLVFPYFGWLTHRQGQDQLLCLTWHMCTKGNDVSLISPSRLLLRSFWRILTTCWTRGKSPTSFLLMSMRRS